LDGDVRGWRKARGEEVTELPFKSTESGPRGRGGHLFSQRGRGANWRGAAQIDQDLEPRDRTSCHCGAPYKTNDLPQ
ncbi:hypothetical protein SKAU_G00182390, partial [Synaphobranchus kaupii]